MKFMNKNAYIQTAIFGHNFCTAAREAFFLVARNISRIAAVGMVSELVLVIGKVLIPLLSTYLFYVVADAILADQLHGLIWVTFVVFSLSIFTATMFIEVSKQKTNNKNVFLLLSNSSVAPPILYALCTKEGER